MDTKKVAKGVFLSFVFLLFFAYLLSGASWLLQAPEANPRPEQFLGSVSDGVQALIQENQTNIDIGAQSAISLRSDLSNSQIFFDKNSSDILPIASLTKLMTAIVVLDNYNLNQEITINQFAFSQAPMKEDVSLGQTLSADSLLQIMLIESSNKSAYALSQAIGTEKFVDLMNQKASEVGMENTFYADPTGLSPQNVSSAHDLAKLSVYILKNYPKMPVSPM